MHIELVDSLRCPQPHDDTWLVASVTRFDGRDIVDGVLGCPICHRQYVVRDGEVDFADSGQDDFTTRDAVGIDDERGDKSGDERRDAHAERSLHERADLPTNVRLSVPTNVPTDAPADAPTDAPTHAPTDDEMLRARALLALGDAGGIVLLGGELARFAPALADEAQVAPLLLDAPAWARGQGRYPSAIRVRDAALPIASSALRGAWLDQATATPRVLAALASALRPGGRLLAPATVPVPAGVRELARDAHDWVGESSGRGSVPVPLRRR